MKYYLHRAIFVCLATVVAQAALADPVDSAAVQQVKQIRLDVEAKKKELADEKRVEAPAPATPSATLELPVDETDSPGATK